MRNKQNMQGIKRLLALQFILCVLITACVLLAYGFQSAISALLGGLVAFIPSALFAVKFFRHQGARAARQIVKDFYVGEFLKILSSILLFTLVFIVFEVVPLAFFLTYIAVVMTHWFAPLILDNKQNGPESD
ncbi:MAG: ATP synthase subunit I [Legionella sp.]|nr:ATP synthase subunit I [Legionella sp.]